MPYAKKPTPRYEDTVTILGTLKQVRDQTRYQRPMPPIYKKKEFGDEGKTGGGFSLFNILGVLFFLFVALGYLGFFK